jgi:hypothetical protein
LAKPKEVFVQNMPISNNLSFIFFPGVNVEEKHDVCSDPFFTENRSVFHGRTVPDSTGFVAILAEAVKTDFQNLWGGLSYLFRGF